MQLTTLSTVTLDGRAGQHRREYGCFGKWGMEIMCVWQHGRWGMIKVFFIGWGGLQQLAWMALTAKLLDGRRSGKSQSFFFFSLFVASHLRSLLCSVSDTEINAAAWHLLLFQPQPSSAYKCPATSVIMLKTKDHTPTVSKWCFGCAHKIYMCIYRLIYGLGTFYTHSNSLCFTWKVQTLQSH